MQQVPTLGIGAFILALIIIIIIRTIGQIQHKKLVRQKIIKRLVKKIRESAKNGANGNDEDKKALLSMVDWAHHEASDEYDR
uniref:Protein Vpu n=1 Tax=Human immunodeficiency virus type 1 TaxID=11676 RepID=A0A140ECV7_HV1|nr:vpu protein [Human immunodeficiency virus 1]